MRCTRSLVLVLSLACMVSPLLAADPDDPPTDCRYVHVVDPCQNDLLVFNRGDPFKRHNIPLSAGFAGDFVPDGVDFATVPGKRAGFSFVTQGPFLRVIDHSKADPWRTIDVELDLDVPGLSMTKIEAGLGVDVGGDKVYPLYATGRLVHPGYTEPVVVVFDQEVLLADTLNLAQALIATVPICIEGASCRGTGLDIAIGEAQPTSDLRQQAYVSVVDIPPDGIRVHRFYRLDWKAEGAFSVGLDPWNDEGVPYDGLGHRSTGLDYDISGKRPFGLFKNLGVVTDLLDGTATCPLIGDATDLEVWGPGASGPASRYHFVTTLGPGGDFLLGFPEGECLDGDEDDLKIPVGDFPRALAIESSDEGEIWIYTANKDHGVSAVLVKIGPDGSLTQVNTVDIPFEGCPSDVTFRDPDIASCTQFEDQSDLSEPDGPDVPCPPGSTDPACLEECPDGGCIQVPTGRRF